MPRDKCPGSMGGNIKAETAKCSVCGLETEIFSDETWIRCPACGARVERRAGNIAGASCYDWCRSARECMGAQAYEKYMAQRRKNDESKKKDNQG
ncbi:MAG: phosphohydrolase [Endomicrobiia bacterium]|nr:phosphohydrolase [Endomicrobiia bacterium]